MHALHRTFICLKRPTQFGFGIVSVKRNEVDTLVSFKTEADAKRAKNIMTSGTWVYKHRSECEFLSAILPAEETWRVTGEQLVECGIGKFGIDRCFVDEDGCIVVDEAYFLNRDVCTEKFRARLVAVASDWGSLAEPPQAGDDPHGEHGGDVYPGHALGHEDACDGDGYE